MLEDILLQVKRPGQYIGGEWNLPKKDFDKAEIKFALCFPDLYEVGMSNLGLRIIYEILNNVENVVCERVFSCNEDMQNLLRTNKMEIFSIESRKRLRDFDIIGFSLGSELNYTNVLNILDLGSIPVKALMRDHTYPLVIGGGPCVLNPEPMHEFFDLFVIGEAEDLIIELINTYRKNKDNFKNGKISKLDLLFQLSKIEGVYVPSFYEVTYGPKGGIESFYPKMEGVSPTVKKRVVQDLNAAHFPLNWLVPYVQIVHDRMTLEIMRGCPNRCRFCQARSQYFPLRVREAENVLNISQELYKRTGYEELSLIGLSVSEYKNIDELIKRLFETFKTKAVSVSLPSLKAKSLVGGLLALIASVKKTGLTFAPEAGSKRLREILAKDFDEKEFFEALRQAYACGYQHVKLYFMIGLPQEENQDLDGIIELSKQVSELRRQIAARPARVNISINTLIPKPHTPLQWFKMDPMEEIRNKQEYIKNRAKNRNLIFSFHNRSMGFLEGVLSRGDRRLSAVIYSAFLKGARFDAWSNLFSFEKWSNSFTESGIDPNFYLAQKPKDEILPWDFIDVGVGKEYLAEEYNKIIAR